MWPARGGKIQRACANVCFQLSRASEVRKAERLCVDGPPSNENGQAASGPAMLVQRGVYVDHQALPQTALLPYGGISVPAPNGTPVRISESLTRCSALVPGSPQDMGSINFPTNAEASP